MDGWLAGRREYCVAVVLWYVMAGKQQDERGESHE
jgi:hypothetical protein